MSFTKWRRMCHRTACAIILSALLIHAAAGAWASPGGLLLTFDNPTPDANDQFGISVAVVGDRIYVGASWDDTDGPDTGIVYVFDGDTGALVRTLHNPQPAPDDRFGFSLSAAGANILVGAYTDKAGGMDSGSAYLFADDTGDLLLTLHDPAASADDWFGYAVASLGDNLVVSAYGDNTGGDAAGTVYVFDGKQTETTMTPILTIRNPTPAALDYFGFSVAGSGGKVLIGAFGDDTGATDAGSAYLFDGTLTGTTSTPLLTINKPAPVGGNGPYLGVSVDFLGNNLLVTATGSSDTGVDAGAAYLFDGSLTGTTSTPLLTMISPVQIPSYRMGQVIRAVDGSILVGAVLESSVGIEAGAVYLFDGTLTGTTSTPLLTVHNPNPPAGNRLGWRAAAYGSNFVVGMGSYQQVSVFPGTAYLFCGLSGECAVTPTPTATPTPVVTPTPSPTPSAPPYVQGYFPAPGGGGEGIVFFEDRQPPNPLIRSYRIQARRVDNPTVLIQSVVFSLPGGPAEVEAHSSQFALPLLDAEILTSWELDFQYKVQGFAGLNATGATLFASSYSYASHPSADVADAPIFSTPPVLAGPEFLTLKDDRPTAKKGSYRYDIFRDILFGPSTLVKQLDHGIVGPFPTNAVHPPVNVGTNVPVVSGDQTLYIRVRREFRNSLGTSLGRYEVGQQSPAVEISAP